MLHNTSINASTEKDICIFHSLSSAFPLSLFTYVFQVCENVVSMLFVKKVSKVSNFIRNSMCCVCCVYDKGMPGNDKLAITS